jgi:hypothetical protein
VTLSVAAALLSGCSAADGFMSTVSLPASDTTTPAQEPQSRSAFMAPPPSGDGSAPPSTLMVNGQQRAYLDALEADGVHPSSDLLALSIGSYVCQARAAGQSAQAVWDYVHPLVTTDVHDAHMSSMPPTDADVDATTGRYIRIASERLC